MGPKHPKTPKRPNPEAFVQQDSKILCLVCHGPSAIFHQEAKNQPPVRLAKQMIRVVQRGIVDEGNTRSDRRRQREVTYVHVSPCLQQLIHDWAKYVVNDKGLKGLSERESMEKSNG